MKKLIFAILLLGGFLAHAGNDGGGGGGFLVNGKVLLLDLVEGVSPKNRGGLTENGLKIVESDAPVEQQVERALNRLAHWPQKKFPNLLAEVRGYYQKALKIRRPIDQGYKLAFPSDANLKFIPESYTPVGIALWETDFQGEDILWIDQRYYGLLNQTHKAALLVHEAVYKFLRVNAGDRDSRRARMITAFLFSDEQPRPINPEAELVLTVRAMGNECDFSIQIQKADRTYFGVRASAERPNVFNRIKAKELLADRKELWAVMSGTKCNFRVTFEGDGFVFADEYLAWNQEMAGFWKSHDRDYGWLKLIDSSLITAKFLKIPVQL